LSENSPAELPADLPANRHANLQANLPPSKKRSTEQANLTKQAKLKKTKTPSKVEQS
jgi:hypothetical protein